MLKWLHILCVIGFPATFVFTVMQLHLMPRVDGGAARMIYQWVRRLDWVMFVLLLVALGSGSMLVQQKGYFYSTPWIEMAFILLFIMMLLLVVSRWVVFRCWRDYEMQKSGSFRLPLSYYVVSGSVCVAIVLIIHDAVTKTTWWIG